MSNQSNLFFRPRPFSAAADSDISLVRLYCKEFIYNKNKLIIQKEGRETNRFSALLFVHLYTTYLFFKRMKLQFDVEMHGILCSIVVRIGSSVLHGKFENLIDVLYFIIANLCLLSNIGFPVSLQDGILLNFF